jgi:hypothetical protein
MDCNTISRFVMTISPQKALIIGILSTGLSGWLTTHLYTNSSNLNANDIGYLLTILEKTEKVQSSKSSQDLHLIVQGQSDPFISSSIEYPQAYDQSTLANLTPGAKIRIGYNKNKLKTTSENNFLPGQRLYIETLDINDHPSLILESSNAAKSRNAQIGKIFAPIMVCLGIILIIHGVNGSKKKGKFSS